MTQDREKSMEEEKIKERISLDSSEKGMDDSQSSVEKDERIHHQENENDGRYLSPIQSRAQSHNRSRSRPQTINSERSYGGEDGYSCNHERTTEEGHDETEEEREHKRWEVNWDGENDPMSPRSMSKARKWAIVLIMASSALCVYVVPTPMRFEKEGFFMLCEVLQN
jgi:hypothetical protein